MSKLTIFVTSQANSTYVTYLQLYQKYQALPPIYQAEVADFVDFLATRKANDKSPERKTPIFGSAKG